MARDDRLDTAADEIADTYLGMNPDETPPEISSLITGDVPTGQAGHDLHGSGATDTNDPVELARRDNARAFRNL